MTEKLKTAVPVFERNGGKMPVLGIGTFQSQGDVCRNAVKTALDVGYRHVDTASMYENETSVGQGIKDSGVPRDDIFLTSKLKINHLDPDGVRASCENTLRKLNTDYLNLLLIHWPEESVPLADTLGAMADLKKDGKIRHLGVSNFTADWITRAIAAIDEPIFCNQIEYHPFLTQDPVSKLCREKGIGVTAYSPLARGQVVNDQRLQAIGSKYNKSAAQIALRWIIQKPGTIAIPKGTSEEHIRANFDIFDFELEPNDIITIDALEKDHRLINPDWAPRWDD
jgi:diketogulonate reductase-like aldo/keto reductase